MLSQLGWWIYVNNGTIKSYESMDEWEEGRIGQETCKQWHNYLAKKTNMNGNICGEMQL